jgi:serine/threonine protein phosphatase 1
MSQTIVVGDIHGCWDELRRLLDKCRLSDADELISVGDLVDRGPAPVEVVRFFMERPRSYAVVGNHEDKHMRIARGEPIESRAQTICKGQLGDFYETAIRWFSTLPLFLEREGTVIVHAGLVPNVSLGQQPRNALLRGRMPWMRNNFDPARHWTEFYSDARSVIYGHTIRDVVEPLNNTWAIDTGACHGGKLTALVLPEFRVVQVDSKKNWWSLAVSKAR